MKLLFLLSLSLGGCASPLQRDFQRAVQSVGVGGSATYDVQTQTVEGGAQVTITFRNPDAKVVR